MFLAHLFGVVTILDRSVQIIASAYIRRFEYQPIDVETRKKVESKN